ncbi:MAG: hypothetical protein AAB781_01610 [Patescibacteria group bacterium]
MRKNYLGVIILTAVLSFVGCDMDDKMDDKGFLLPIKIESDMTLLKIERRLALRQNPVITILAKGISFDYNKRIIVIEGLVNIAGYGGGFVDWVVPKISVVDNSLVITIPMDSNYNIQIGENRFYLPVLK